MLDMMHIDRRHGRRAFEYIVKSAGKQLHEYGRWIVMFPEGTRSKPGQQQPYKSGGARLALKNDTPIVPVAVNSGRCWPKKPFIKQPGLITVSWGPVISVAGKTAEQINQEVELWIETRCDASTRTAIRRVTCLPLLRKSPRRPEECVRCA